MEPLACPYTNPATLFLDRSSPLMLGLAIDSEGIGRFKGKVTMNQKRGSFSVERLKVQVFPDRRETACPATILRRHENSILFLDQDSARLIDSSKRSS
jgi:hypothetical protein